ncbi:hypothetical protein C3F09_00595 [candidate division GN15 bacterium]|uniref:Outer membrane protein beta-barrel domain-containing protein n=1 Tax=candidate division GN15 bacterium TaxID=2072418 RepID=A0A855XCY7_9BACT|nr:MAG: hypothetical protein C3F09_00595 [candidate division GN15 bacterium]
MRYRTAAVVAAFLTMLFIPLVVPGDCAAASSGLGLKAGWAFAKQDYNYSSTDLHFDNSYRTGFGAGVFVEQPLIPLIALRAEGMYIQKGFKSNVLQTDLNGQPIPQTSDLLYRVDYISTDILGKASLPTGTYVMAGPRLDFKVHTNQNAAILPVELEDRFASTLFGWTFGVGQSFAMSPSAALFVEGQLYIDQSKLYDRADGGITTAPLESVRNKSFAVYAGIRF